MYYADSLARVYGPPGCGKSFMVLDQAMTMATGGFWCGHKIERGRVVYVMAEGQSVNRDRAEAWMSRRNKTRDDLRDYFYVVPDAVALTEVGVRELAKVTGDLGAAMVVLDTKNAMMIGEENSASDFARMRRALDSIRKASGCCVVLVDHTGYEGTRARGSSAATAAMDTEIRVSKDDDRPALVTAEVTRDKAGEPGSTWAWRLVPEHPAAVLEPTTLPVMADRTRAEDTVPEWSTAEIRLPNDVLDYRGSGAAAVPDLARMMMFETNPRSDPEQIGLERSQAVVYMKNKNLDVSRSSDSVRRAWSALKSLGLIVPALDEPTDNQEAVGRHVWAGPIGVS